MNISEWSKSEEEKSEILNLAMKAFGKGELIEPEFFDWQYKKNPEGDAVVVTVKDPDNNNAIIGVNAFLPMSFGYNQKIVRCFLSCNSIIDPDYRKKGIFTQLVSKIPEIFAKKEFSIIYGIPNLNSRKIFSQNHFLEISKLPLLVKPLNLSSYFDSQFSNILKPFDIFWKPKVSPSPDIKFLENEITSEFDELMNKSLNRSTIIHFRNKEFLQWRYIKHPTRDYKILTLRNNSKLSGYIVTREMEIFSKKIGVIVDFMLDSSIEQKTNFQNLVKTALLDFWKNDISIVIATSKFGMIEEQILRKSGFFKAPSFLKQEQIPLIISTFNENFENFKNFDEWYFVLGDYDVF